MNIVKQNIFEKDEYNIEDIQSLIDNEIEESNYLEYKESRALHKEKKKDIAKDVLAFANSGGGIIIYGVKERKHKPIELSYIDGTIYTKEWLEQVIYSNIQRKIDGLKIIAIRNNQKLEESLYIVKILESTNGPHMLITESDNRYYKRHNFTTSVMNEYEIRNVYLKSQLAKLEICDIVVGSFNKYVLHANIVYFHLKNTGNVLTDKFKLNILVNNELISNFRTKLYSLDAYKSYIEENEKYITHSRGNRKQFTFPQGELVETIFSDEKCLVFELFIYSTKECFEKRSNYDISVTLFDQSGVSKREFNIKDQLKYGDLQLKLEDFN